MQDVLSVVQLEHVEQIAYLAYPDRTKTGAPPPGFVPAERAGKIDAVILTAPVHERDLARLLREIADPLLPVASVVPARLRTIDGVSADGESVWTRVEAISSRLRELSQPLRRSIEFDDVLLAWMYSRDRPLAAVHDEESRDLVSYPLASPARDVAEAALRLHGRGFVTRGFFDRISQCPRCRSSRLSVREECSRCRSPNTSEETTVHHFRCGHIAPESHFAANGGLDCPKCRRELRHIGLDYDRPGSITCCNTCAHTTDKPAVGFKCISCDAHHPAEAVPAMTWYSFELTSAGVQRVLSPGADAAQPRGSSVFDIVLDHCDREQREFGTPFSVILVRFTHREVVVSRDRRLWVESMRLMGDVLHSALRSVDVVCEDSEGFRILMPHTDAKAARSAAAHVVKRTGEVLAVDPGVRIEILGDDALRMMRHAAVRP